MFQCSPLLVIITRQSWPHFLHWQWCLHVQITTSDALKELVHLDESFASALAESQSECGDEELLLVALMGDFAHTIVDQVDSKTPAQMQRLFQYLEALMQEGEEDMQTAIATGFLESLLSASSSGRLDFARIVSFLGPLSRQYCKDWDEFTGCFTPSLWAAGEQD